MHCFAAAAADVDICSVDHLARTQYTPRDMPSSRERTQIEEKQTTKICNDGVRKLAGGGGERGH